MTGKSVESFYQRQSREEAGKQVDEIPFEEEDSMSYMINMQQQPFGYYSRDTPESWHPRPEHIRQIAQKAKLVPEGLKAAWIRVD